MKNKKKIMHPGLKCNKCGQHIYSYSVHDFKHCNCGACFVDGGFDYFRYGSKDGDFELIEKEVFIKGKKNEV